MKKSLWIPCLFLGTVVAACGGSKKEEVSCAKVGDHLATLKWSTKDKATATCKREQWSKSEKSCLLAAKDVGTTIDCMAARIRKDVAAGAKKAQKATVKPLALKLVQAKSTTGDDLGYSIRLPDKYEKSMCNAGKNASCYYGFSSGSRKNYEITVTAIDKQFSLAQAAAHASKSRYGSAYTVTKREAVAGGNYLVILEPRGIAAKTFYFAKTQKGFLVADCSSPPTKKHQANLLPVCQSVKPTNK